MAKRNSNNETFEKIAEWLEIYHSSENAKEREKVKALIVTNMYPVVKRISRTIARRSTDPIEDMIQAGFIGLLKAIDKYDKYKNDNFRVYAGYFIIGEIKHYLRDKLSTIKVPAYIQQLSIRIRNFTRNLTYEEVQKLTSDEVASALETSPQAVSYAMDIDRRKNTLSLDELSQLKNSKLHYEELLADNSFEEKSKYADIKMIFDDIIDKLPDEEKLYIDMYYKQDMSQREIADALQVRLMLVNRRLKQAFDLIAELVAENNTKINKEEK